MRLARWRPATVLPVLVLVATSCGVGVQARPQPLATRQVPGDLLETGSTSTSTTSPPSLSTIVYFEGLQRLVAVRRSVHDPLTVGAALDRLASGPSSIEAREGLTSPASSAAPFTVGRATGGVVNVDVAASFTSLAGASQIVAVAQLVYTATAVSGIKAVTISIDGQPTDVPTADGSLSGGPLTRADYATIGPRPPDPGQ